MKLSKHQREQHRGAARDLIQRLEGRLAPLPARRYGANEGERIAEKVSFCKERLRRDPKDKELININMELADLFYLTSNAAKSVPVKNVQRGKAPHTKTLN